MFQTRVVERSKTHILCSITFFLNRAVYEMMQENVVEEGHIWQYGTCALHTGYLRLQMHIH